MQRSENCTLYFDLLENLSQMNSIKILNGIYEFTLYSTMNYYLLSAFQISKIEIRA